MLWPGSRLPLAPWAWRRHVQPRPPRSPTIVFVSASVYPLVSSEGYKDSGGALRCPPARFTLKKNKNLCVFSFFKSSSVTLVSLLQHYFGTYNDFYLSQSFNDRFFVYKLLISEVIVCAIILFCIIIHCQVVLLFSPPLSYHTKRGDLEEI